MKKRLFGIALLFMMVVTLVACGTNYTPPDFGEKGYMEHYIFGFILDGDDPEDTLITSMKKLKEFRETVKTAEHWYAGSDRPNYDPFADQLETYSSRYFKENLLIAFTRWTASGMYSYTVKDVKAQNGTITVTLQYWKPASDIVTTGSVHYGFLIEFPKGKYSDLKVEVEDKYQAKEWEED